MTTDTTQHIAHSAFLVHKLKSYYELLKFRLSFLVAFSSGFGYILGSQGNINWATFTAFCLGGLLVSGGSITINQIIEKDYDKVMKRTMNRPLPTQRVSRSEAAVYAAVLLLIGFSLILIYANLLTLLISIVSMLLYCFVYTPLKRVGPIAVFVGAIPGALPPFLGWVAATGHITYEAWIIFGIQFIWQFPHFWAIAWLADEDYKKAGFKLLPANGTKDMKTAINIMIYTLFLLPLGLLPAKFGVAGINSAIIATICGVLFLAQTFSLMRDNSRKSALKIMYGSFLYLPIVQIAYLVDKI
ncbi:MAG: protoheme IX farnesyltransferase [Cyclobacteriaceae bacterium]|nr:protoheme IX farnesyltransferase [Cyclobacteriaceae bacterium]